MRRLLPSVWLVGAALYTALILVLSRPAIEEWPLPPRVDETVVVKQPPRSAGLIFTDEILLKRTATAASAPVPPIPWRDEWAQIAGYTAMGRAHPSSASPVLFAYSVGRPLRVLSREGGFARVQDLGSGQLGWVEETSLAPFTGGYSQPEQRVAEPVVAAAEPVATVAVAEPAAATMAAPDSVATVTPVAVKAVAPVAAKKAAHPRVATAAQPGKDVVAAAEPAPRGLFRRKRNQVQHVALGSERSGVAAIMQRALGRF
jgi:hypothetical protein